jgi:sugar-specific transcriptional regulator TrmB
MKNTDMLSNMLKEIGFNDLESKIYITLLENSKSTGYKIAGQINKPVANTYKALKSLELKGAVISDRSSKTTFFETVPVEEFLNKMENEFAKTRKGIVEEVQKLNVAQETGGIFELKSVELVYEKAFNMIKSAEKMILIDCFPAPLKVIKECIEEKSNGNVPVYLKNYCDTEIKGIKQITTKNPHLPIESLAGQWLMVLKDTEESLIAMFSKDGTELQHSVWTKDRFLSFVLFNGSIYEFNYTQVHKTLFDGKDDKIKRIKDVVIEQQNILKILQSVEKNVYIKK